MEGNGILSFNVTIKRYWAQTHTRQTWEISVWVTRVVKICPYHMEQSQVLLHNIHSTCVHSPGCNSSLLLNYPLLLRRFLLLWAPTLLLEWNLIQPVQTIQIRNNSFLCSRKQTFSMSPAYGCWDLALGTRDVSFLLVIIWKYYKERIRAGNNAFLL